MDKKELVHISSLVELDEEALKAINSYTLKEYTADELFAFKIKMCDNDIDRDREAFSDKALEQLAELYKGKTVIFNHSMNARDQSARIYATEIVTDETKQTVFGSEYRYLLAYAYMPKTEKKSTIIENILSGIQKEVSVGCCINAAKCSICDTDLINSHCAHRPGKMYDGKMCVRILDSASDAYEVSFVAVPAQPQAGTIKSYEEGSSDEGNEPQKSIEKSADPTEEKPSFAESILRLLGGNN